MSLVYEGIKYYDGVTQVWGVYIDSLDNTIQHEHPYTGVILGLRPANERQCYCVTTSLIYCVHA